MPRGQGKSALFSREAMQKQRSDLGPPVVLSEGVPKRRLSLRDEDETKYFKERSSYNLASTVFDEIEIKLAKENKDAIPTLGLFWDHEINFDLGALKRNFNKPGAQLLKLSAYSEDGYKADTFALSVPSKALLQIRTDEKIFHLFNTATQEGQWLSWQGLIDSAPELLLPKKKGRTLFKKKKSKEACSRCQNHAAQEALKDPIAIRYPTCQQCADLQQIIEIRAALS